MKRWFIFFAATLQILAASSKTPVMPPPGFHGQLAPVERHSIPKARGILPKQSTHPAKYAVVSRAEENIRNQARLQKEVTTEINLDGESQTYTTTFEWDQYGFPAKSIGDASVVTTTYDWFIPGQKWSLKRKHYSYDDGTEYAYETHRTFHPNGSVATSIEKNVRDTITNSYDENGFLISRESVNRYGEHTIETWTLFPLTGKWISTKNRAYNNSFSNKSKVVLLDDYSYAEEEYWLNEENGEYELKWILGTSYPLSDEYSSSWRIYYQNINGEIKPSGTEGDRFVVTRLPDGSFCQIKEVPEVVDNTLVWNEQTMWTFSSNWFDDYFNNAPGHTRSMELQQKKDGIWQIVRKETLVCVKGNIYKETEQYYEPDKVYTYNNFRLYTGEYKDIYNLGYEYIHYNESTGMYVVSSIEDDNVCLSRVIYNYYDSRGELYMMLRYTSLGNENNEKEVEPCIYEIWNGDEWVRCTTQVELRHYVGSRDLLTFNEKGQLISEEEFDEDNKLKCKFVYSYTEYGYIRDWYQTTKDNPSELSIRERSENSFKDNIYTEVGYEPDSKGAMRPGSKVVCNYNTYKVSVYYWSDYDSDWRYSHSRAIETYQNLPDNKLLHIERHLDSDGNVVNFIKEITGNRKAHTGRIGDFDYYELYFWDDERNDWEGSEKYIAYEKMEKPDFDPISPQPYFDDEYFTETPKSEAEESNIVYVRWDWDNENWDWVLYSDNRIYYEMPDATTLITKANTWTKTEKIDGENRMLEEETDYGSERSRKTIYSYDADGNLLNVRKFNDGELISKSDYTYCVVKISDELNEIESQAAESYTVYNLQGIPVRRNADINSIGDLPAGTYIVGGHKIQIR